MTDQPAVDRLGGSYVVDPKTGKERRVAGTELPDANRPVPADPPPEVPTAPAAPAAPDPAAEAPAGRKAAKA